MNGEGNGKVEIRASLLYRPRMDRDIRKVVSLTGQQTLHSMQHTLYSIMPIHSPQYAYVNTEVSERQQTSKRYASQPLGLEVTATSFLHFTKK
jgi:hypothetical protein